MQKPIPEKSDGMTEDVILQLPLEELHAFHDHPYKIMDDTATERINHLMPILAKQNGATEKLKAKDQMAWVGLMNNLRHQVDEMILDELIYT